MTANTRKRRRFRADGSQSPKKDTPSRTDLKKHLEQDVEFLNVSDRSESGGESSTGKKAKSRPNTATSHAPGHVQLGPHLKYDPDDYYHAKKKLKKAVLESYRSVQIFLSYSRRSNITLKEVLRF